MRRRPQVGRSRRPEGETQAVLLDALGTLVELEPPVERLRCELRERFGLELSADEAGAALRAEIAFYRAHHDDASDRERLADLRRRSAEALRVALPAGPARELPLEPLTDALLAALRFRPFEEVPEVLGAARELGLRLVVVSNWDVSLHDVLADTGLAPLLDGVVTSAEIGSAKPARAIFARGLALAGVDAHEALHVGDSVEHDVAGARAAAIAVALVVRNGNAPASLPDAVPAIPSLRPLLRMLSA
jgi:putative hydrolase of the HAD superfamily